MTLWELFLDSCEKTKLKGVPGKLKFSCTVRSPNFPFQDEGNTFICFGVCRKIAVVL